MAPITRFEDIEGWKAARVLSRELYRMCASGAQQRDFGFKDQICRAGTSVMNNIAEGYARRNDKEFARFLDIARASAVEVQSMLYLAQDIGYINEPEFKRLYGLAADAIALISALARYLRKSTREDKS